jgi:hypothetical protein
MDKMARLRPPQFWESDMAIDSVQFELVPDWEQCPEGDSRHILMGEGVTFRKVTPSPMRMWRLSPAIRRIASISTRGAATG